MSTTSSGKRYLDFITGIGVNALGHAHPRHRESDPRAGRPADPHSNLYYHQYQGPLAKRLAEMSGLQRASSATRGTEAMEGALKMVHSHGRAIDPEKYEIIALENSFHGRTLGALSITGQPKYRQDFEPLVPGVKFVPANDVAALEAAFSERTAGIVLELIQGEGGIYPLTPRVRGQGARTGRPPQRAAGRRRDAVRRGPAGHLLRLPALALR